MSVTYEQIRAYCDEPDKIQEFTDQYDRCDLIRVLAEAESEDNWPLGYLKEINPELACALEAWTADQSLEMSYIQQHGSLSSKLLKSRVKYSEEDLVSHVNNLERHFCELPLFPGCFTRDDDDDELDLLKEGCEYEAPCFKAGFTLGGDSSSRKDSKFLLHFEKSRSARLVGALSLLPIEREVLIPKGARYLVTRVINTGKQEITLCEVV